MLPLAFVRSTNFCEGHSIFGRNCQIFDELDEMRNRQTSAFGVVRLVNKTMRFDMFVIFERKTNKSLFNGMILRQLTTHVLNERS